MIAERVTVVFPEVSLPSIYEETPLKVLREKHVKNGCIKLGKSEPNQNGHVLIQIRGVS